MFFILSKVFAMFLFPYPLFLVVSAFVAWRMPRSRLRAVFRAVLIVVWALSLHLVSSALMGGLEGWHPAQSSADLPRADAVVVLAGMVNSKSHRGGRPEFVSSVDRILLGEELLRMNKAPVILLSGGSGFLMQRGESESRELGRWLESRGVPSARIVVEANSRNTAENARETIKIARARGWSRLILVTSAFHMPRSVLCFRRLGFEVVPAPVDYYTFTEFPGPEALVPSADGLSVSTLAVKEYVGLLVYRLRGFN